MSSYVTKFFAFILGIKKPTEVGSKSGKRDASMKSLSLPRFYGDREKLRMCNEVPFKKPKSDDTNISKIFYVNFEKILDCCVKIFPLKCAFGEWFGCFPLPFRLGLPLILSLDYLAVPSVSVPFVSPVRHIYIIAKSGLIASLF